MTAPGVDVRFRRHAGHRERGAVVVRREMLGIDGHGEIGTGSFRVGRIHWRIRVAREARADLGHPIAA